MSIIIDLIYAPDCPNLEMARAHLSQALSSFGSPVEWREWDQGAGDLPREVRGYGSPTILINGKDVAGSFPADRKCCRLYQNGEGSLAGAPSVEMILTALRATDGLAPGPEGNDDQTKKDRDIQRRL